jgi:hypothetical protein
MAWLESSRRLQQQGAATHRLLRCLRCLAIDAGTVRRSLAGSQAAVQAESRDSLEKVD